LSEESSTPAAEEIRLMSNEFLKIEVLATGAVVDTPYRRAVSLLSRGLAVIADTDPVDTEPDPGTEEPQPEPEADVQDAQGDAELGEQVGGFEPPQGDEVDLEPVEPESKPRRSRKKSNLSTPAPWGQEGDSAENEPPKNG
jgi:hypothetical protein